jgi:hypothetical protein
MKTISFRLEVERELSVTVFIILYFQKKSLIYNFVFICKNLH